MGIFKLFDYTFFKFLIGFGLIITLSFVVLYLAGRDTSVPAPIDVHTQVAK